MIEFLKRLLSDIDFKSDDKKENKYKKIIYLAILLCAVAFIGLIIYFVIQQLPVFIEGIKEGYNNSKSILNGFKF